MSRVVGLDLSLTSTGIAVKDRTWTVTSEAPDNGRDAKKKKLPPTLDQVCERLDRLSLEIVGRIADQKPDLLVVEAPIYTASGGGASERAGLWWDVVRAFRRRCQVVKVAPTSLKTFATGSGKGGKAGVLLATGRHFPWFQGGDDESDALWLAAMGHQYLGEPLFPLPKPHLAPLRHWPPRTT